MRYYPIDMFEINCPLQKNVVIDKLSLNIEPKKAFSFLNEHAYFQGSINTKGFEVSRIINYGNSFLPIIKGQFLPEMLGTTISIKMELNPTVKGFMCFGLGGCGLFIIAFAGSSAVVGPILMLVFGYILTLASFCFEAKKQKEFIIELLTSTEDYKSDKLQ
jgi:hypothetical protein